jgi:hypothetical protein
MTIILTANAQSDTFRARELEATGTDPGPWLFRLHRDTCDRMGTATRRDDAEATVATNAQAILAAKACSRCKAPQATVEALKAQAAEHIGEPQDAAEPTPEPQATPEPEQAVQAAQAAPVPEQAPEQAAPTGDTPKRPRSRRQAGGSELTLDQVARHPSDGRVLALTPSLYPEVAQDVPLYCPAHNEVHPASAFRYLTKRGNGDGRPVECRKAWEQRLSANKALAASGQPKQAVPHVDDDHLVTREG